MKKIKKFLLTYVILIILLMGVLVLACSFPSSWIKDNVVRSSETLSQEGNRKICFIVHKFQWQEFDNYSDSLMINTAYSIDSKTPVYAAFTAKKNYIPGVTKEIQEDVVGELKSSAKYEKHDEVGELEDTVNGISTESFEYAKYWHGYLSILRPLLLILDYHKIRILITIVLAILAIIVTTEIAEKKNYTIACLYLFSLMSVEYFYIGLTLINSIMFLIMMMASLILVKRYQKIKDFNLFFFVIGICVGFFGLLDIPLLTFASPLILFFVFQDGEGTGNGKQIFQFLFFWILGYALTWMAKWVLMDMIYHRHLLQTALEQVLYRSIGKNLSPLLAICINLLSMALPIMIAIMIILYLYLRYHENINSVTRKKARVFFIISILPMIWYMILANHSVNHFFFAYRLLFISMLSGLLWIYYLCGEPENSNQKGTN